VFLNRLANHIRRRDWFVVFIELVVVIVGLVLAFQIDRWREESADRKLEAVYLQRLTNDIESDIPPLESAIRIADMRKNYVELLMAVAEDPAVALEQPMSFLVAIDQASFTFSPSSNRATYEDLRSTGNMRLIRNQELKTRLNDYYGYDETESQFRSLQLSQEFHFFKLVNGVRSNRQIRLIQDRWLLAGPEDFDDIQNADPGDPEELMAAVDRFRNNPEAVSWLLQLRQMQMEQIMTHNIRIDLANSVLDSLQGEQPAR